MFNTLASHMGSMGMAVWCGFKILGEHWHEVLCSLALWCLGLPIELVFNTLTSHIGSVGTAVQI
jgi:hypothetical protein